MKITPLLLLVAAHIMTDFVLQSKKGVQDKFKRKIRSPFLYIHVLITGLAAYLFLQQWTSFGWPLLIMGSHFIIDTWKLYHKKDNLQVFLLDQILHIIVLVICWLGITDQFNVICRYLNFVLVNDIVLIYLIAFLFVIWPAAFIISKFTQRWRDQIVTDDMQSLSKAGKYIGILERVLVLIFVLLQQFGAIGFLVAAKSIMRFSEKSETQLREKTEYILIGTLLSFAMALVTGLIVKMLTQASIR